jgi:cytochrome b involved in lipid metabolism
MQARGGDFVGSPLTTLRRARVDSNNLVLESKKSADISSVEPAISSVAPENQKLSTELWCLHGEFYDLTNFISTHPGGTTILNMSKGMEDATPLMESYHAFANHEYIRKTMAKYKVDYVPKDAETRVKPKTVYGFDKDGFYATLTRRVRAHFGSTKEGESVTKNIKANKWWVFKVATQSVLFAGMYGMAFFMPNLPRMESVGFAAGAGLMLIAVGMNAMHDGSHYAVGVRDSWKNKLAMRVWNAIAYWDPSLWLYHHTIRHHAYTGDDLLDPDTMHANPAVRKHLDHDRKTYFDHFPRILAVHRWFWTIWATFIYVLTPGMYTMQVSLYLEAGRETQTNPKNVSGHFLPHLVAPLRNVVEYGH